MTRVVDHKSSRVPTLIDYCPSVILSRNPVEKLRLVHKSLKGRFNEAVDALVDNTSAALMTRITTDQPCFTNSRRLTCL